MDIHWLACGGAAVLALSVFVVRGRSTAQPRTKKPALEQLADGVGTLDLRRQSQIALGGPRDFAGQVILRRLPNFDLNTTIFRTVEGVVPRLVIGSKIGVQAFWSDAVSRSIMRLYTLVPSPAQLSDTLVTFITNECDFSAEHADGSFMDHLRFCYEYSCAHFKSASPLPLFLHSVMGVATNVFPMDASKIPMLKKILTAEEWAHVEAFPSIQRLLNTRALLDELAACSAAKLATLHSIHYHRVIDNVPASMTASQLWRHLNYRTLLLTLQLTLQLTLLSTCSHETTVEAHFITSSLPHSLTRPRSPPELIHLLDFLPTASWALHCDDALLAVFVRLHGLLESKGKLEAVVDFDLTTGDETSEGQPPLSLGSFIKACLPTALKLRLAEKAIRKFSSKIGHSLEFELTFA